MISQSVSLKRFFLLSTGPWYPFMFWPFGCLIVLLYFVFQIYGTVWSSWNTFFCSLILDSLVIWPCWLILNSLRHSSLPSFCDATLTYFYLITSVTIFSSSSPGSFTIFPLFCQGSGHNLWDLSFSVRFGETFPNPGFSYFPNLCV